MINESKLKAVAAELRKRQLELKESEQQVKFDYGDFCFPKQTEFFRGEGARFRTAVCSRRAGKTVGIAADAIATCLEQEDVTVLYITLTQQNARNIIWGDLERIIEKYEIKCKLDQVRLTIKFPNRSRIAIAGAKDRQEIEKYRGWKLRKCYIDECQSFRPYIEELVNDIISPALRDLKGELYLTGTPGPVPAGYFYQRSQSDFWENHKWTAFDNPHMHNPPEVDLEETLAEERELKGIDENDPGYLRETYGMWVEDQNALVFKFNPVVNTVPRIPDMDADVNYLIGIDIGFNDADAIAVLAYNNNDKIVYLVEERLERKQNISALVGQIYELQELYKPIKIVMDAGALGKKIHEELVTRHQLNIQPADKARKVEFIELLNDDLRTAKFKAYKGSVFEEDCMLVQWDRESKIRNPERPKISTVYHSDICDAVLYAWRECKHFLSEPPKSEVKFGTTEYMLEMERKEAETLESKDDEFWDIDDMFYTDYDE